MDLRYIVDLFTHTSHKGVCKCDMGLKWEFLQARAFCVQWKLSVSGLNVKD